MIQKWDRTVSAFVILNEIIFTVLRIVHLVDVGANVFQIVARSVAGVLLIGLAVLLMDGRIVGRVLLALLYLPLSIYLLANAAKAIETPFGTTVVASSVVGLIIGAYCLITAIKLSFKNT